MSRCRACWVLGAVDMHVVTYIASHVMAARADIRSSAPEVLRGPRVSAGCRRRTSSRSPKQHPAPAPLPSAKCQIHQLCSADMTWGTRYQMPSGRHTPHATPSTLWLWRQPVHSRSNSHPMPILFSNNTKQIPDIPNAKNSKSTHTTHYMALHI